MIAALPGSFFVIAGPVPSSALLSALAPLSYDGSSHIYTQLHNVCLPTIPSTVSASVFSS